MLTVWAWGIDFAPYMQLLHFGFGVGAVIVGLLFGSLQVITEDEVRNELNRLRSMY